MSKHRAVEYVVEPTGYDKLVHSDKHLWTLHVCDRGAGWAVVHIGRCLNKDGEWEYESIPSERSDEFLARTRWKHADDALKAAHDRVDGWKVNGLTAQEASDDVAARLAGAS